MRQVIGSWISLLVLLTMIAGCGGPKGTDDGAATEASGPKIVSLADLPALGRPLALEGGRVEISPPDQWKIGTIKKNYVARFFRFDPSSLPRILIQVTDGAAPGISVSTKDNLPELEKAVTALIDSELVGSEMLLEPTKQMIIGRQPWIRYVRKGRLSGMDVERQILRTASDGRIYTIELQVIDGKLLDYRDDAYAVAAGVKFLAGPGGSGLAPEEDATDADAAETDSGDEAADAT